MQSRRAVIVVDMQNGVFTTPRSDREGCTARINALTQAADMVIFIQHTAEDELREGSDDFALLPELNQPADAFYVTKTAATPFTALRSKPCCASRTSATLCFAAARRITAWMPPLKTASAGVIALP